MEVSTSGYFTWARHHKATRTCPPGRYSDEALLVHMRAIHDEVKQEYGWPRMNKELVHPGIRVGKERVRRLIHQHGIRAKSKRKFVVQRKFNPDAPNQLWSGDITYIATNEGWVYLAAVIDLFSRQVVRWSMKDPMQTSLVKDAWTMARFRRRPGAGLIFHSDRGSQYCSHGLQNALKGWDMHSSMSRKGNCWADLGFCHNAPTESFWGRLKTASLYGRKFATRQEAMDVVLDWMAFYNHRRLHSTLGYLSPLQYEERWHTAQRKKAA